RSRKIPPRGLRTIIGCALPERSITSTRKNFRGRANACGLTGSASCTLMVFSGVGLGSSAWAGTLTRAHTITTHLIRATRRKSMIFSPSVEIAETVVAALQLQSARPKCLLATVVTRVAFGKRQEATVLRESECRTLPRGGK